MEERNSHVNLFDANAVNLMLQLSVPYAVAKSMC